jgi:DNA adenine methylase
LSDGKVNIKSWHRLKNIHDNPSKHDELSLGYATFFLNRTNRSGILTAGVIGGKNQDGKWKLDARFNTKDLIQRIEAIAEKRDRITFTEMDAVHFLQTHGKALPKKSLVYLDPPYYLKGKDLYTHFYEHDDHVSVAKSVPKCLKGKPWIVSYDDAKPIHEMYQSFRKIKYRLSYSAQERYQGGEVMFFCPELHIPSLVAPMKKVA